MYSSYNFYLHLIITYTFFCLINLDRVNHLPEFQNTISIILFNDFITLYRTFRLNPIRSPFPLNLEQKKILKIKYKNNLPEFNIS